MVASQSDVVWTLQALTGLLAVQDSVSGIQTVKLPAKARRAQLCRCVSHMHVCHGLHECLLKAVRPPKPKKAAPAEARHGAQALVASRPATAEGEA